MKAIRLKTEFLYNPIGVDFQNPTLSWNCEGGVKQTAYRIVAKIEGLTVWDSGKVESCSMKAIYPKELHSRERVEWSVTLWDECDREGEPSDGFFEMGLLKKEDFQARLVFCKE